jgi:hypothetical protein
MEPNIDSIFSTGDVFALRRTSTNDAQMKGSSGTRQPASRWLD